MGRLIDSDLLDEEVMNLFIFITGNQKQSTVVNECKNTFRRMIDEQPTAYDLEEVMKKLKEKAFPDFEEEYTCNGGLLLHYDDVIEIIRGGTK